MNPDHSEMLATAGQLYAAWLAATIEVGGRALHAAAAESGSAAERAAAAFRAPTEHRGTATEDALHHAHEAQRRLLHGISGLPTLWGMTFLSHLDAARHRQPPP